MALLRFYRVVLFVPENLWQTPFPVVVRPSLAFSAGLAAGIAVTRRLHNSPDAGGWGERIGRTRLRFANLPVGGTIAIAASLFLPRDVAVPVRALGAGALVGAVGWGVADPLPQLSSA